MTFITVLSDGTFVLLASHVHLHLMVSVPSQGSKIRGHVSRIWSKIRGHVSLIRSKIRGHVSRFQFYVNVENESAIESVILAMHRSHGREVKVI